MSNGGGKFTFFQFESATGIPYVSCKLYHYAAGTTTDKDIWTDEAKTTAAAQPIVGDSRGIVTFYADGDYKFVLKDSADNTLYTWDNVRITSDSATMWENNHGTAYPTAAAANIWQMFAKHTAGNVLQEVGINNGTAFVPIMSVDKDTRYAADSGAADAYVVTLSPVPTAYTAGMTVYMKATNANTGASTINVNSLGIKSIKKDGADALIANDILAGQIVALQYGGTNFQLMSPSGESVYEDATQTLTNKTITGTFTTPVTITSTLATGTAPFTVTSTTVNPNVNVEQHNGLKIKVIDIGDWDMDATTSVLVSHGVTATKIRTVSALIRNDSNDYYFPVTPGYIVTQAEVEITIQTIGSTTIELQRKVGGTFDSTSYNSTSYNRGWITIWYIP